MASYIVVVHHFAYWIKLVLLLNKGHQLFNVGAWFVDP